MKIITEMTKGSNDYIQEVLGAEDCPDCDCGGTPYANLRGHTINCAIVTEAALLEARDIMLLPMYDRIMHVLNCHGPVNGPLILDQCTRRVDDFKVPDPVFDEEGAFLASLRCKTDEQLLTWGMQLMRREEDPLEEIWVFPLQWVMAIPNGTEVWGMDWDTGEFVQRTYTQPNEGDDIQAQFGALSFGIKRAAEGGAL